MAKMWLLTWRGKCVVYESRAAALKERNFIIECEGKSAKKDVTVKLKTFTKAQVETFGEFDGW